MGIMTLGSCGNHVSMCRHATLMVMIQLRSSIPMLTKVPARSIASFTDECFMVQDSQPSAFIAGIGAEPGSTVVLVAGLCPLQASAPEFVRDY